MKSCSLWTMRLPFKNQNLSAGLLPPPLTSAQPGTWAHDTMTRRVPRDIMTRILADNREELDLPTATLHCNCREELTGLLASVEAGEHGRLLDITGAGPDLADWAAILAAVPEEQRNWLHAPWLIVEFYFYRRVAAAFGFFSTRYDMFQLQKAQGLVTPCHRQATSAPGYQRSWQVTGQWRWRYAC